jgi:hypothetical protein
MTTLPSIKPNSRELTLGDIPQQSYIGPSGVGVRFVQGSKRVVHTLVLSYVALTEAQLSQFYSHYEDQEGSLIDFDVPSTLWAGYTAAPVNPADYNWRYAGAFQVETAGVNRFNITIELESVII